MPVTAALPFIIGGATAAGSIAQGRAAGREKQAQANQQQDQLRLVAQQQGMQSPRIAQQDMVRAMLMGNAPTAMTISNGRANVPQSTGGVDLNAMAQNPAMKQLAEVLQHNALMQGMKGYAPSITPTPQPQAGLLDKILGGVGTVGALAGGAMYGGQNIQNAFPSASSPAAMSQAPTMPPGPVYQPGALYGGQFGYTIPRGDFGTLPNTNPFDAYQAGNTTWGVRPR